jgi:hypothetical protein
MKRLKPIYIKQAPAVIVGPALIEAGHGPGIRIENVGDVIIKDVIILGSGRTTNQHSGICIENSSESTLHNILIDNVDVSGFREDGIRVYAKGKNGYNNININNCRSHDNGLSGITVGSEAYPATPHSYVRITNCLAYQNTGIPGLKVHSGSGIVIDGFRDGVIQLCEAYENGALCDATDDGGPVGIWAYNCFKCAIQYNISHNNHSNNNADGGGFDLDFGATNSVMHHNWSYQNDGYGFQIFDWDWPGVETVNNRVYNNISWYDCQRYAFGAFAISNNVMNSSIYSNIAFLQRGGIGARLDKWQGSGVTFANNIYFCDGMALHLVLSNTNTTRPIIMRDSFIDLSDHPDRGSTPTV